MSKNFLLVLAFVFALISVNSLSPNQRLKNKYRQESFLESRLTDGPDPDTNVNTLKEEGSFYQGTDGEGPEIAENKESESQAFILKDQTEFNDEGDDGPTADDQLGAFAENNEDDGPIADEQLKSLVEENEDDGPVSDEDEQIGSFVENDFDDGPNPDNSSNSEETFLEEKATLQEMLMQIQEEKAELKKMMKKTKALLQEKKQMKKNN